MACSGPPSRSLTMPMPRRSSSPTWAVAPSAERSTAHDLPVVSCADQAAWRAWLSEHHADSTGTWLEIAKAQSDHRSVTYAEAVDEALCFGWIDGQKRS